MVVYKIWVADLYLFYPFPQKNKLKRKKPNASKNVIINQLVHREKKFLVHTYSL